MGWTLEMPIYQGTESGMHVLRRDWFASGALPDGRSFAIAVKEGFVFDGCSIPRLLWRLCGHPMEVPRVAAALAHDWLYAAHVCKRAEADQVFKVLCKMVELSAVRIAVEYSALKWFGGAAWRSHGPNDEAFARARGAYWTGKQKRKN